MNRWSRDYLDLDELIGKDLMDQLGQSRAHQVERLSHHDLGHGQPQ